MHRLSSRQSSRQASINQKPGFARPTTASENKIRAGSVPPLAQRESKNAVPLPIIKRNELHLSIKITDSVRPKTAHSSMRLPEKQIDLGDNKTIGMMLSPPITKLSIKDVASSELKKALVDTTGSYTPIACEGTSCPVMIGDLVIKKYTLGNNCVQNAREELTCNRFLKECGINVPDMYLVNTIEEKKSIQVLLNTNPESPFITDNPEHALTIQNRISKTVTLKEALEGNFSSENRKQLLHQLGKLGAYDIILGNTDQLVSMGSNYQLRQNEVVCINSKNILVQNPKKSIPTLIPIDNTSSVRTSSEFRDNPNLVFEQFNILIKDLKGISHNIFEGILRSMPPDKPRSSIELFSIDQGSAESIICQGIEDAFRTMPTLSPETWGDPSADRELVDFINVNLQSVKKAYSGKYKASDFSLRRKCNAPS